MDTLPADVVRFPGSRCSDIKIRGTSSGSNKQLGPCRNAGPSGQKKGYYWRNATMTCLKMRISNSLGPQIWSIASWLLKLKLGNKWGVSSPHLWLSRDSCYSQLKTCCKSILPILPISKSALRCACRQMIKMIPEMPVGANYANSPNSFSFILEVLKWSWNEICYVKI